VAVSEIYIHGIGAVSPAGWTAQALTASLTCGEALPVASLDRPGWQRSLSVRRVPAPDTRPAFAAHARLRRTSPIAHYSVSVALEALGEDAKQCANPHFSLGIVLCVMSGCVNYSRRFYDEVLKDPSVASPLVFPETVYNSPASHLAALLGTRAVNYTLVGDPGTFLQGLALAADWLLSGRVDGCLVLGAEEMDWLTADAMQLFDRNIVVSDGAGALYLRRDPGNVRLKAITNSYIFHSLRPRIEAARRARAELAQWNGSFDLLLDGLLGSSRADRDEAAAWSDWQGPRLSVKKVCGEGFMAAAAWQCVAAVEALRDNRASTATVSIVGCHQQAIAAQFTNT
jgi:hypothetical protein